MERNKRILSVCGIAAALGLGLLLVLLLLLM